MSPGITGTPFSAIEYGCAEVGAVGTGELMAAAGGACTEIEIVGVESILVGCDCVKAEVVGGDGRVFIGFGCIGVEVAVSIGVSKGFD